MVLKIVVFLSISVLILEVEAKRFGSISLKKPSFLEKFFKKHSTSAGVDDKNDARKPGRHKIFHHMINTNLNSSSGSVKEFKKLKPNWNEKGKAFERIKKQTFKHLLHKSKSPLDKFVFDSDYAEIEKLDENVHTEKPIFRRTSRFIEHYPVWNGGSTLFERRSGFIQGIGLASTDDNDEKLQEKFEVQLKSKPMPAQNHSEEICQDHFKDQLNGYKVKITSERYIHTEGMSDNDTVIYADRVSIRGIANESISILYCLINASDYSIIRSWEGLQSGWKGGNPKLGMYRYGQASRPNLTMVSTLIADKLCEYSYANKKVQIFDMKSKCFDDPDFPWVNSPYVYPCDKGPVGDDIKKGYGPLNDGYFHTIAVLDMFFVAPFSKLPTVSTSGKVEVGIHYGHDIANAMWLYDTGGKMVIGDGGSEFYSLASCLDVLAHEIGHGITETFSGLIYDGESGCLNEGFSDAMGETAKAYIYGKNDWCIGGDCTTIESKVRCLRDMTVPAKYSDYFPKCKYDKNCQSVHLCSAIPNYAFYRLATTPGWNVTLAAEVWITANRFFWRRQSTLKEAACATAQVVNQAEILGGDTMAVIEAWGAAGVKIWSCVTRPSYGSNYREVGEDKSIINAMGSVNNPIRFKNCDFVSGISGSTGSKIYFAVEPPKDADFLNIQTQGNNGMSN